MAVKKVTRRWLFNSFAVIVLIIVVILAAAGTAVYRYYYEMARQALSARADSVTAMLVQYSRGQTTEDFTAQMRDYVAGFPAKATMELMIIDNNGSITMTSSGFYPDDTSVPEYYQAIADGQKTISTVMDIAPGGHVMVYTVLAPLSNVSPELESSVSALRLITSLSRIDRQIAAIIAAMVILGVGVLILILFSSSYFISSIVNPVGQIGETARRIAQGDFAARLQKRNDDEIGELCDIINHMAFELDAAERLKNDFISSVSHELRTPLTAIQGWAETILSDGGHDSKMLERGMGVIIGETGRLSSMVEELLDFSRMQSGRLKLIRTPIDALAELAEAVLMYTQRAEREGIELTFDDDGVSVPVYGDKNRLRQVFINIIDNAIKYSDRGGKVTITTEHDSKQLIIRVADTGIGIRAEDLPQVKTKFFKADSTRRGSGIGLAVADEIITRHDGTLEMDSVYGEGSTVTIILPVRSKADDLAQIDILE